MRYHLSNRQQKELDRGNGLDIAIPAPWFEYEPDTYFLEHVAIDAGLVSVVRNKTLCVNPISKADGDMYRMVGEIINEPEAWDFDFTIQVQCIVGRIVPRHRKQESQYPCQWPGRLELG